MSCDDKVSSFYEKKTSLLRELPYKYRQCFMFFFGLIIIWGNLTGQAYSQPVQGQPVAESKEAAAERHRRNVAVALNYCRASFHRIRKYPTQIVMQQEQQKILNNLNLNIIRDAEIIRLYSDVLDEIGQVQLSEKEQELFDVKYKKSLRQEMTFDALTVGLNLMTASYLGAVRTGANSWWDYRNFKWSRDHEVLKLEKSRVNSVVKKSSSFMDTFWRLTQKNNIPDRWLIRSSDLDDLEKAMNQRDPQTRLRILKRMKPFMECYPPYWYYVARTEQTLGQFYQSMATYERLAVLETGHFRRDDMLATALANQAVIQAHLGQQTAAVKTAKKALGQSAQVWEANLACAKILEKAGELANAEDAILRNLDVDLERKQSSVTLLSFYYDTNNTKKLAKYLADEKMLVHVPPPVLIRFASKLPKHQTPAIVWTALASSMRIEPQLGFGEDSIIVACHPVWKIDRSKVSLHYGDRIIEGEKFTQNGINYIRFAEVTELGGVLGRSNELPALKIEIQYGEKDPIQLAFAGKNRLDEAATNQQHQNENPTTAKQPMATKAKGYHLIAAQWGKKKVAYVPHSIKVAAATSNSQDEQAKQGIKPLEKISSLPATRETKNAANPLPETPEIR